MSPSEQIVPAEPRPREGPEDAGGLVERGAELVALTEAFRVRVFTGVIGATGLASLAAVALLPVRASADHITWTTPTVLLAIALVLATPPAVRRGAQLYHLVARHPALQLVPAAIAAALLAYPLRSELWWPALALCVLLGVVAPPRRALLWCLGVLLVNLAAHLVAGDLDDIRAVTIAGLWVGIPFWTATASISVERFAVHLMLINQEQGQPHGLDPPRRVAAWANPVPTAAEAIPPSDSPVTPRVATSDRTDVSRLTSRQLEVIALLADGLTYRDVAACLAISVRQVQRHVRDAVARLDVQNANELVARAVAEGLVPPAHSAHPA